MSGEEKEEALMEEESEDEDEGPRRRRRRAATMDLDDLIDFEPSDGDESEDEDIAVNDEELARELEQLRGEQEQADKASTGEVAHPDCGVLYDTSTYELRSVAPGKEPCFFWKYCVCLKKIKGSVRCLLCPPTLARAIMGLGSEYKTGNMIRHFKDHHPEVSQLYLAHRASQAGAAGERSPPAPCMIRPSHCRHVVAQARRKRMRRSSLLPGRRRARRRAR